jgi:hypothetical protein
LSPVNSKRADELLSALEDIVDRAIDYTNQILHTMPTYRSAAIEALRKLRENLARQGPDDPALRKLDDYLDRLAGDAGAP